MLLYRQREKKIYVCVCVLDDDDDDYGVFCVAVNKKIMHMYLSTDDDYDVEIMYSVNTIFFFSCARSLSL